jgi:Matrixin
LRRGYPVCPTLAPASSAGKSYAAAVRRLAVVPILAALALPAPALGKVASATGVREADGQTVYVDVVVAVPKGQSVRAATDEALRQQGARRKPPGGGGSTSYAFSGLKWDVLPVHQSYNPFGQVVPAQSALTATESTWSSVSGSAFRMSFDGTTSRCPSLVRECRGPQSFDGHNDVGWQRLGGSTLGVTWFGTSIDEADTAISNRFRWNTGCTNVSGSYDVQTVMLHENGHVAGLDHVNDPNQVMYPSYLGARCTLGSGDQAGLAALY